MVPVVASVPARRRCSARSARRGSGRVSASSAAAHSSDASSQSPQTAHSDAITACSPAGITYAPRMQNSNKYLKKKKKLTDGNAITECSPCITYGPLMQHTNNFPPPPTQLTDRAAITECYLRMSESIDRYELQAHSHWQHT